LSYAPVFSHQNCLDELQFQNADSLCKQVTSQLGIHKKNISGISNTERRAKKVAWVQIRIEIPTCKELNECEYPARSLEYTVFKTDTQ
jgi:hypothetical protein